jgi:ABC-type nickel/cobalt efflux system permease component RcnA
LSVSQHEGWGSISYWSMWDSWWADGNWDRLLSGTFVFHCHSYSTSAPCSLIYVSPTLLSNTVHMCAWAYLRARTHEHTHTHTHTQHTHAQKHVRSLPLSLSHTHTHTHTHTRTCTHTPQKMENYFATLQGVCPRTILILSLKFCSQNWCVFTFPHFRAHILLIFALISKVSETH